MAGVWNVNSTYDVNTRKIMSKLSFDMGEVFLARIVSMDPEDKELLLKMLDGWQFTADLEKPMDTLPNGLVKFRVVGFENGKLKIVMLPDSNNERPINKDSIDEVLEKLNLNIDKGEHDILQNMVKHNMPLTRENVSMTKNLVDFMIKINSNEGEEESFISKYLQNNGIDKNTSEAKKITDILKGFFKELKNINVDDLLTLMENNIELSEDNIKSYNKVFKEPSTIYKDIKQLKTLESEVKEKNKGFPYKYKAVDSNKNTAEVEVGTNNQKHNAEVSKPSTFDALIDDEGIIQSEVKNADESIGKNNTQASENEEKTSEMVEKGNFIEKTEGAENTESSTIVKKGGADTKSQVKAAESSVKEAKSEVAAGEEVKCEPAAEGKIKDASIKNTVNHKVNVSLKDTADAVREQISAKTDEIKNVIKNVIEQKNDVKLGVLETVAQTLKGNMNDFKVFNSVSNQYYYMDLPVNVNNSDYQCKLIIKDERKKGKKIDTKDVKIAASVKTINMNTVDAYIRLNNYNMSIDIKCDKKWIKIIESGKTKLEKEFLSKGYNVCINVDERENEVSLTGCRDFFDDNTLGTIDTRA